MITPLHSFILSHKRNFTFAFQVKSIVRQQVIRDIEVCDLRSMFHHSRICQKMIDTKFQVTSRRFSCL
jgi:hypothetical protein